MAIPVVCSKCGALFASNIVAGNAIVQFSGCETNCPACGRMTAIADGSYEMSDSTVRTLKLTQVADLQRLQAALEQARQGSLEPAEVIAQAEAIDPQLGRVVRALNAMGGVPLLIALIALYLQFASMRSDDEAHREVTAELRASNARQEQLLEAVRSLIRPGSVIEPSQSRVSPRSNLGRPAPSTPSNRHSRRKSAKTGK